MIRSEFLKLLGSGAAGLAVLPLLDEPQPDVQVTAPLDEYASWTVWNQDVLFLDSRGVEVHREVVQMRSRSGEIYCDDISFTATQNMEIASAVLLGFLPLLFDEPYNPGWLQQTHHLVPDDTLTLQMSRPSMTVS